MSISTGNGIEPYYAALFRQRPVTAETIRAVVADYFQEKVSFHPLQGGWYRRDDQSRLGIADCTLGAGAMLGPRCHRADLAAEIRIGPLTQQRYRAFLPGASAAHALAQLLAQFGVAGIRYRVRLVLRSEDVSPCCLCAPVDSDAAGLGQGVFLHGCRGENSDFCYDVVFAGTVQR